MGGGYVRTAVIRLMKMLRDERMAFLGKLRCGDVMSRQWLVWAVRVGRVSDRIARFVRT
jgi:hypothetical protein